MEPFDFIIVGGKLAWESHENLRETRLHATGGAAGCLLVSRLAQALKHNSILLINAGGNSADVKYRVLGERC